MKTLFTLTLIALMAPIVTTAQNADPKPKAEKKVCRSAVPTGSIMPKSTCHTRAEWQAIDAANQADAQSSLDRHSRTGAQYGG